MLSLLLDHQLQESVSFADAFFPIQYYVDDLNQWPDGQVPLHWHFGYEVFSATGQDVWLQIGDEQRLLRAGESVVVGGGQLHSYRLSAPGRPCLCPNIVFSEEVLAPLTGTVFQKYLRPLLSGPAISHVILSPLVPWQAEASRALFGVYGLLCGQPSILPP